MQFQDVLTVSPMLAVRVTDTFPMAEWPVMDSFLSDNYRPQYVMRDRRLFAWQFGCREHSETAHVVCAYSADRLVGILGYRPTDVFWGDTKSRLTGAWMANWMVTPEHRHGAGALMMRRLMEKYDILLGQGAGKMNVPIAKVLKFSIFDRIPRFIAVFDADKARDYLVSAADMPPYAAPSSPEAYVSDSLPEGYAPDWSAYPGLAYGTVRDATYLRWRYVNHPIFRYEIKCAGSPLRPAICVYRIEETRGDVRHRVGRLTEFFFPQDAEGARNGLAALSATLTHLQSAGCVFADHYSSAAFTHSVITATGMVAATDLPLATRLSPFERTHHHQNLEVWCRMANGAPTQLGDVYVTKADGDQDRPN